MLPRNPASAPSTAPAGHLPVEVLRRYVAGKLPPAEEHRVEAHTLDCPTCAAMLEGLEMQPASVTDASLHELRQRLAGRVEELAEAAEPAVVPLWPRLAAAAVLVLLLSTVAWLTLRPASEPVAVATAPAPRAPQPAPAAAPPAENEMTDGAIAVAPAAPAAAPAETPLSKPASRPEQVKRRGRSAVVQVAPPTQPEPVGAADAIETASGLAASTTVPDTVQHQDNLAAAAPKPSYAAASLARSKAAASPADNAGSAADGAMHLGPTRTVRGRITDQTTGQGLPGVTVLVPGTQLGVSTGPDGHFQLAVPTATSKLAVSSIGYTTQQRRLGPADSALAIVLAPDTKSLSEVVVVRREAPPAPVSISAMPAGGYASFQRYLRDSLDYPEKALTNRVQGTVKLRFAVGADGKLSDIQVVKKLSDECDAEAIRLLREGPAWFPAVQNGRRLARKVEVSVPFKLE